jgi:hypothetical protein
MDWHGTAIKEGYAVVYLCGEDDEGLELNTVGWFHHYDIDPRDCIDRIIFANGTPDLMSADNIKAWYESIHRRVGDQKAVVFLDTWQRASSRAGQNKDEDMQLCVHHAEALAESLGGPLLGAFHPPKHNEHTILGSSIIENNTSAIWQAGNAPEGVKLEVTRIKGYGVGNYGLYHFDKLELEELDDFGKRLSAIVPSKVGGTDEDQRDDAADVFRQKRLMVAKMIRGFWEYSETLDPSDSNRLSMDDLNANNLSIGISSMNTDPDFRAKYMEPMKKAPYNIEGFGTANVRKLLEQYFTDDHENPMKKGVLSVPETFEDATTLGIVKDGKRKKFVLKYPEI